MPTKLPGKRKDMVAMNPDDCLIAGYDTTDDTASYLHDERTALPPDEAMIKNIMAVGVHQPIGLNRDGDKYYVVYGRQRVLAAREANRRLREQGKMEITIEATIKRGSQKDLFGISLSENELRRDDSPMVKARKVNRYMQMGADEEEAAVIMGVTTKSIANWLKLLECDEKVQKAVDEGRFPASAAMKLSALPRKEQVEQMAKMIEEGTATTQHAAAIARVEKQKSEKGEKWEKAEKGGSKEPDPTVIIPPPKRTLKKVLLSIESQQYEMDPNAVKMLKWVLGMVQANTIKGLTKIVNDIEAEKESVADKPRGQRKLAPSNGKGPVAI